LKFFCPPKNWEIVFPGVKSGKFAMLLEKIHKFLEKETPNFEQNPEESCDIKFEFCDIKNLAKFSQNSANVVKFTLEKKMFPKSFVPTKKKQKTKKRKNWPPTKIKTPITLCVFTTNKELLN
jgi:hypothetical protein